MSNATSSMSDRAFRRRWGVPFEWVLVVLVSLLFLGPVVWMAASSLKPEAAIHEHVDTPAGFVPVPFTVDNYVDAAERSRLGWTMLNSLLVVALVAVGGIVLNGLAAYAFARMDFPGRELIFMFLVASIIIPLEVIVIPLFMTVRFSAGLQEVAGEYVWTMGALSVPFCAKAFNIYLMHQAFLGLPRSLEEAAFIDGMSWWGVYWRIALPNVKPTLVTVVVLDFVIHWNDFLWPLVICDRADTRTIQLGLQNFFTKPPIQWGDILAYAILATIPLMAVFVLGQRWIISSMAGTGLKQ